MIAEEVQVTTLSKVFDDYLPNNTDIDIMSIDVEGAELDVLRGNDWTRSAPKLLIIEPCHYNYEEINKFLMSKNYTLVYNNIINSIFVKNDFLVN